MRYMAHQVAEVMRVDALRFPVGEFSNIGRRFRFFGILGRLGSFGLRSFICCFSQYKESVQELSRATPMGIPPAEPTLYSRAGAATPQLTPLAD